MSLPFIKPFHSKRFGVHFFFRDTSDGTVWINVEHAVRAVGIILHSGEIAWDEVNRLLKSFGYGETVNADSYIPLNFFFKLAIAVDTEKATAFKDWITDRVMPKIFTTGKYDITQDEVGTAITRAKLREFSKVTYKSATHEISKHIELAHSQGDNRPKERVYAKFAAKVNKVAGLPKKGGRDSATMEQLAKVIIGTQIQQDEISIGRKNKRRYSITEDNADKRLNSFAALLPKSTSLNPALK